MRYEYKVRQDVKKLQTKEVVELLNAESVDRWELVTLFATSTGGYFVDLILRREVHSPDRGDW